jgi:hypothetical protein
MLLNISDMNFEKNLADSALYLLAEAELAEPRDGVCINYLNIRILACKAFEQPPECRYVAQIP